MTAPFIEARSSLLTVQEPCEPKSPMSAFCEAFLLDHNVVEVSYSETETTCHESSSWGGGAIAP